MLVAALGCGAPDGGHTVDSAIDPDSAGAARERLGVIFDPLAARPGERVGGLEVAATDVRLAVDSIPVGTIAFRGELSLRGRRIPHFDVDLTPRSVCFEADSISAMRLPRWRGDRRRPWFCFQNASEAESGLMAASEKVVRVVIDEFTIRRGLSDQVNSARFVRAIDP
jgi:hypothetical protein